MADTRRDETSICRACMNDSNDYKALYKQGLIFGEVTTLANMLSYCTNLEFVEEDELPSVICNVCVQQLTKAYKFKQQVLQSNNELRSTHEKVLVYESNAVANVINKHDDKNYVMVRLLEESGNVEDFVVNTEDGEQVITIATDQFNMEDNTDCKSEHPYNEEILQVDNSEEDDASMVKFEEDEYEEYTFSMADDIEKQSNVSMFELDIEHTDVDIVGSPTHKTPALEENNDDCTIDEKTKKLAEKLKQVKTRNTKNKPKLFNPDLMCKVCGKQLSNSNSFKYHMQLHSDSTPYLCCLCGEGFKTRNAYEGHSVIHDPNNPNTCEVCGKSYRQPSSLRSHMLTHTGERPFKCDICGKGMTQKSGYKKHMLTHTGEKPHVCDYCGREFRYSSNLIAHRRNHTGEKPYECSTCQKCFVSSEQLKRHKTVHTGERPYNCQHCGKHFKRRSSLTSHLQTHYNNSKPLKEHKASKSNIVQLF